jgi:hypothetical protein
MGGPSSKLGSDSVIEAQLSWRLEHYESSAGLDLSPMARSTSLHCSDDSFRHRLSGIYGCFFLSGTLQITAWCYRLLPFWGMSCNCRLQQRTRLHCK